MLPWFPQPNPPQFPFPHPPAKANKNKIKKPLCSQIVTYLSLDIDIRNRGGEFMEKYLTENYPSMEWKPLFEAIINGNVTEEMEDFSLFRK